MIYQKKPFPDHVGSIDARVFKPESPVATATTAIHQANAELFSMTKYGKVI
jgi:hypothetical protein